MKRLMVAITILFSTSFAGTLLAQQAQTPQGQCLQDLSGLIAQYDATSAKIQEAVKQMEDGKNVSIPTPPISATEESQIVNRCMTVMVESEKSLAARMAELQKEADAINHRVCENRVREMKTCEGIPPNQENLIKYHASCMVLGYEPSACKDLIPLPPPATLPKK